jgi:hypothetical protein
MDDNSPRYNAGMVGRGDFWFHDDVFKPEECGGFTEAVNIYLNHTLFPALAVHYSSARRAARKADKVKP